MTENNTNKLNIELSEEVAQGTYVNLAVISHSSSEFVIDLIRLLPGLPKAHVKSRIIMTPENTKRLLMALNENIQKYEAVNGEIKNTEQPTILPMNFGGTKAQA